MNKLQNIHHLLNRAAFGPSLKKLSSYKTLSLDEIAEKLFSTSNDFSPINIVKKETVNLQKLKTLSQKEKQELRKKSREMIMKLNLTWFEKMSNSEAVLREKMTLFWHDHFACRTQNAWFAQDLNNRLRKHALGNFGELLMEVTKSPAMLQFLNNQQNKKEHPNENFARELMELFTLGRNNYTENDIKNAARAFTGWGFNLNSDFVFRRNQHDYGRKQFLGETGDFDGEQILGIILNNRRTARFITRKIYQYFVNEEINEAHIDELSTAFYNSGYNLNDLMKRIFSAEWFYENGNHQAIVKSPVELLVGYARLLPVQSANKIFFLVLQRAIGQVLFYPPNVGGWPMGKEWIDSTSLTLRMQLPLVLAQSFKPNINRQHKKPRLNLTFDWNRFNQYTQDIPLDDLALLILGKETDNQVNKLIHYSLQGVNDPEAQAAKRTQAWISLPEYQLS